MPNDPQGVEDMRGAGESDMDDYAVAPFDILDGPVYGYEYFYFGIDWGVNAN